MTLSNPLVTICVPVYNVERYIERCARSLFGQSYSNLEYVFVDDCSPDGSIEKLRQVLQDYPNRKDSVTILKHERNRGLAVARNTAVEYANGQYLTHVDSDDWLSIDAVENLVDGLLESDAEIVSGNMVLEGFSHRTVLKSPKYSSKQDAILDFFQLTYNHVLVHRLIKTSLYRDNGVQAVEGVNVGEDHYTLPRLMYYSNGIHVIDKVVYHYDITNTQSYLHSNNRAVFDGNIRSFELLADFFEFKESVYSTELEELRMKYLKTALRQATINRDYTLCNNILSRLKECDKESWKLIGYEKAIVRYIFSHPSFHRFLLLTSWRIKGYLSKLN